MENEINRHFDGIAVIKAQENGVTVSTVDLEKCDCNPPVRLDNGEVYIMNLSKSTRGYKIRGKVVVLTSLGEVQGHSSLIVASGIDLEET